MADDPWRVLGVEPSAPLEEARQAYLLRSQLVHPDRHQGAAPRVRAEAERAMRELNDAWLAVQHLRGTPAEDDAAEAARAPTDVAGCVDWVIDRLVEAGRAEGKPLSPRELAMLRMPLSLAPSDRPFARWVARRSRTLAVATREGSAAEWSRVARVLDDERAALVLVLLLRRR